MNNQIVDRYELSWNDIKELSKGTELLFYNYIDEKITHVRFAEVTEDDMCICESLENHLFKNFGLHHYEYKKRYALYTA